MKKNTLLMGVLTLLGASSAFAQNLVIPMMRDNADNIEIIRDGTFDVGYGDIGFTSNNTLIYLGEVDFGADGNAYQATGVEFAQGYGGYDVLRYVVLYAGNTFEESVPFTEMEVIRTFGYHCFETFAWNMKEEEGFTRPTGKQKVWLTFREGSGNLRSIIFYKDRIAEEGMQPWINTTDEYKELSITLEGGEFERGIPPVIVNPEDPENPKDKFESCVYDEDKGCWGGIIDGFVVKSTEPVDFGEGEYQQLVAYISHEGERYREYMEFYIDEVKPENMIARTWSGINLSSWNDYTPIATKLKEVKGSHYLFVKWGDATNLQKIDLVKEKLWFENPDCGVVFENVQPSENAVEYNVKGEEGVNWEILVNGSGKDTPHREDSQENIGFTSNGVVVAYYGVDFKDGEYQRVIIRHSCDKNWLGNIEEANFSLYIDLDQDINFRIISTPEQLKEQLAGHEPFAVVRAQGTGSWGIREATAAPMTSKIEGVHDLYVVYNLPDGAGANIYNIYLDPEAGPGTGIQQAAAIEGLEIYSVNSEIIVNTSEDTHIAIYTISGIQVKNETLRAGSNTINDLPNGMYILKATNKAGVVNTSKLMVR